VFRSLPSAGVVITGAGVPSVMVRGPGADAGRPLGAPGPLSKGDEVRGVLNRAAVVPGPGAVALGHLNGRLPRPISGGSARPRKGGEDLLARYRDSPAGGVISLPRAKPPAAAASG
jgi:hypothetical protein